MTKRKTKTTKSRTQLVRQMLLDDKDNLSPKDQIASIHKRLAKLGLKASNSLINACRKELQDEGRLPLNLPTSLRNSDDKNPLYATVPKK